MIKEIVEAQRKFYLSGATRTVGFRLEALNKLKRAILNNEEVLSEALAKDLNKSRFESYLSEIGIVLDEISYHEKRLRSWMKDKRVPSSMGQLPGRSYISPEPFGVVLIMTPWNYPINLSLEPLIGAISAGNTAVVKPSAYAPASSAAIAKVIRDAFSPEYVAVVEGGRQQNTALLDESFDYIFFTGSSEVGRTVMEAASRNLTPVTLELGGKSPTIVDETANIALAAKRIAFGKVMNAGQTCVEPDYLLIHENVKALFVKEFEAALKKFFPDGDLTKMVTIITKKHYDRVKGLMAGEHTLLGGAFDDSRRFIEPTLLDGITLDSPIMKEEIFGPVLPILTFKKLDECISLIHLMPRPLALYLFTGSKAAEQKILNSCSFGGGCVNDTILHFANPNLPFGGVGASGMGSYHGKKSFETFTHYRSIFKQSTIIDVPIRYLPYTEWKRKLLRMVLK